jgi:hypothetical protein
MQSLTCILKGFGRHSAKLFVFSPPPLHKVSEDYINIIMRELTKAAYCEYPSALCLLLVFMEVNLQHIKYIISSAEERAWLCS